MSRTAWILAATLALSSVAGTASAVGLARKGACACHNCRQAAAPWHGGYYHAAWGAPVALVVPPTAEVQTHWGWGVGNTRVTPICPQFGRNWPGPAHHGQDTFRPTPPWPSDTDQFGVYYVRGPW